MQERILTPEQVAQILQVHQFTVLKFIKQGRLIASKIGRVYRIRESDLESFLDNAAGQPGRSKNKKESLESNNLDIKSKNKNKPSLNSKDPVAPAAETDEKIIIGTVEKIETENQSQQQGGQDQYFILN
ncbi:helix-turn-helix domain-containing protein [Candidatus Peregrinibacteria bacterium]|nr:helix-turn-helix domain-containing protein [Candidatus Peregrinibacteria bacterium]